MVYVCAQIEDIFRFRRDRLGFYAEIQITFGTVYILAAIQITFGTVYILAAIQITFGTVYMLGQAGRPADSLQIWSAKYPIIPVQPVPDSTAKLYRCTGLN